MSIPGVDIKCQHVPNSGWVKLGRDPAQNYSKHDIHYEMARTTIEMFTDVCARCLWGFLNVLERWRGAVISIK